MIKKFQGFEIARKLCDEKITRGFRPVDIVYIQAKHYKETIDRFLHNQFI